MRFVLVRLALLPISVLMIVSVSFFILALLPGDVPRALLGPTATPDQVDRLNQELGLDRPVWARYSDFITDLAHGDLGTSYYTSTSVSSEIGARLPATVELVVPALIVAIVLGVLLGSVGAYFNGRLPDKISRAGLTVAQSIPDFLLGLLLIWVFYSTWHLLPGPEGRLGFADQPPPHVTGLYVVDGLLAGDGQITVSALRHLVLPAATLGIVYSATFGRTARALVGRGLNSEFTRFGRACGLSERRLLWNALLSARTSLMTYAAIIIAGVIGGDAVVEIVFSWNGVGQWAVQSMLRQDLPAVVGFVVVTAALTVTAYLVLDVVAALLDPRIRFDVKHNR